MKRSKETEQIMNHVSQGSFLRRPCTAQPLLRRPNKFPKICSVRVTLFIYLGLQDDSCTLRFGAYRHTYKGFRSQVRNPSFSFGIVMATFSAAIHTVSHHVPFFVAFSAGSRYLPCNPPYIFFLMWREVSTILHHGGTDYARQYVPMES